MKTRAVIVATPRHLRELDNVPDETIDEKLNLRLSIAAARLSLTLNRFSEAPEKRPDYIKAMFRFGVLAGAKYEYKTPEDEADEGTPGWLRGARAELEEHVRRVPSAVNLLQTTFFSSDVSTAHELERFLHAGIEFQGTGEVSARQYAAEIALHGVAS
jgi:hypothetical protein